jgi:transposase
MEAIVERCCGLDVHQATVVACLLTGRGDEKPRKQVRSFSAVTKGLLELSEWLHAEGCTHVAMESTGVYWKPVYAILEDSFDLTVGNARHIRNVPGRKTDVKDSEWIADLLRHGLIAKSFVPPQPIRMLRDLVRYRRKLVQSRASERNRLLKLLETCGIKLSSYASNVFGVSGMAMLHALVQDDATPAQMAQLARGRMRDKIPELELALEGRLEDAHRFLLKLQMERLSQVDVDVGTLDARIAQQLAPHQELVERVKTVPGVDRVNAASIVAEIGIDMSVFRSEQAISSWAGVCPGNHESAGKRQRGTKRLGNVHLTTALVEAAQAAIRKKDSYYRDKFHRLKARRGYKRALVAIAHKILIAIYNMLRTATDFRELGAAYLDRSEPRRAAKSLVKRLESLGYDVQIAKRAA